ncbi:MAG TPA: GLPGLI family protein [Saprospiraceae bacterium]|nr:GLPGLI family protein [Saprospiraceae bacterium]HMP15020.1 GLPGLI family protein [Saprospiraceae bacterium]
MKKILTCYLLISAYVLHAQTIADYIVYYNFIFITDTVATTFSSPEEFKLLRVGQESKFAASAMYYNDSIMMAFKKDYPEPDFKSPKEVQTYVNLVTERVIRKSVRSNYKIIKNFQSGSVLSFAMYLSLPLQHMEEPMALAWELTGETDTILGLSCMQAVTNYGGRRYYAWFTLEVPINDGPYVFQGLPGLILRIVDDKGWYTFTATNITTDKSQVVIRNWMEDKSQKVDRKTFVQKTIAHKQNPTMPTSIIDFPEDQLLEQKKNFEKRFDLIIEQL